MVKIKYNLSLVSKTEPSSRTKLLSCLRCVTSWPRIDCQSLIHFICDMMSLFLFLNIHLHECDELFNIIFSHHPLWRKVGERCPFWNVFPCESILLRPNRKNKTVKQELEELCSEQNLNPEFWVFSRVGAQAAQAHVSRKSQRLIHERVTRCVTRC